MAMIFDPYKKEQTVQDGRAVGGWKEIEKEAVILKARVINERKARGEKFPEYIPVIHRATGELRHFNFRSDYAGALNHAEACLHGPWRFASPDEERAGVALNEQERQAALQRRTAQAVTEVAQKIVSAVATHSLYTPAAVPQSAAPATPETKKTR